MNNEEFIEEIKKLGIILNDYQLSQLEKYYHLLVEWNKKFNLTRIIELEEVYLKHFYDSLTLVKGKILENESVCDLGSGAGFPGIVLKVAFPEIKLTLIESSQKKCLFLKEVIEILNLKNVEIINDRIEIIGKNKRETFDIVTARALAKINILLEYSAPLLKKNALFIAMKSEVEDELNESSNALKILGLDIESILEFFLPNNAGKRTIIVFKKNSPTPFKYPRNYKEIKNKSL